MRRIIPLLMLLGCLTACAAAPEAPPAGDAPAVNAEAAVPSGDGALSGESVFSQPAPEDLIYTVELETLTDSAEAEDGTVLIDRSYQLPVMTVKRQDGTPLTEAAMPAEEAALAVAETFNNRFRAWVEADSADEEQIKWAEEDRAFRTEAGQVWISHTVDLDCTVYQTEELVSVAAVYFSATGGAHPNTVLLAWNFDLTTGQFFTPELLASDGQAFSQAVTEELLRQSQETAASYDTAPEDFFWPYYQDVLANWSSYAVSFDETGMTVAFSQYDLAAYVAGPQVYHLPYEMLEEYLSPHGLAMLGLAAVEK